VCSNFFSRRVLTDPCWFNLASSHEFVCCVFSKCCSALCMLNRGLGAIFSAYTLGALCVCVCVCVCVGSSADPFKGSTFGPLPYGSPSGVPKQYNNMFYILLNVLSTF